MRWLVLVLLSSLASATTRYVAQSAGTFSGGTACNGQTAITPATFNSTTLSAGDVTYGCGTITASAGATQFLIFNQSGTSGSPITFIADTGFNLTAPYWGGTDNNNGGAFDLNGQSYIVLNGANAGTIQATESGTGLTYQPTNSVPIYSSGGSNNTVENWTIENVYVHTSTSDEGGSGTYGVDMQNGSNLTVSGNTIHDTFWGVRVSWNTASSYSNWQVSSNTIYNVDHGVFVEHGSGVGALSGAYVFDNTVHDLVTWDDTAGNNHHDYMHVSADVSTGTMSGVNVYNNYGYGDPGANCNTFFFSFPDAGVIQAINLFNNIFVINSTTHGCADGYIYLENVANGSLIANNTFLNPNSIDQGGTVPTGIKIATGTAILENNVMVAVTLAESFAALGQTSDYNDFYAVPSNGGWFDQGTYYYPLSSWMTHGYDSHSINTNPNLSGSYVPASGSPVIGAGVNLYSTCNGQANPGIGALCFDEAGNVRSNAAFTMGALNAASSPPSNPAPALGMFADFFGDSILNAVPFAPEDQRSSLGTHALRNMHHRTVLRRTIRRHRRARVEVVGSCRANTFQGRS